MKKTHHIHLVLITAALASCHSEPEWHAGSRTYIRGDSTAPYTLMAYPRPGYPPMYYVFRPYGIYAGGAYRRVGYYSEALGEEMNIGRSPVKSGIVRGGFGESTFSVES
jgi:hypothetical protein